MDDNDADGRPSPSKALGFAPETWFSIRDALSASLRLRDVAALCSANRHLRDTAPPAPAGVLDSRVSSDNTDCRRDRIIHAQALAWARRHRLANERRLASWSAAALADLGVLASTPSLTCFVRSSNRETGATSAALFSASVVDALGGSRPDDAAYALTPARAAAVSLFALGVDFGFFRQSDAVRDAATGRRLDFRQRRDLDFLACARVDATVHRGDDGAVKLRVVALCVLERRRGDRGARTSGFLKAPAVAVARFDALATPYDLSGFSTHLTACCVADSLRDLLRGGRAAISSGDAASAHDALPPFGSAEWLRVLLNTACDCPRKFYRLIDQRVDLVLRAFGPEPPAASSSGDRC